MSRRSSGLSPRLANKGKARHPKAEVIEDDEWFEEPNGPTTASSPSSSSKTRIPPTPFRPKAQLSRTPVATSAKRSTLTHSGSISPPSSPSTPTRFRDATRPRPALPPRAPLKDTIRLLTTPFRLLLNAFTSLLLTFLSPFIAHLVNTVLILGFLGIGGYFLGPWLASKAFSAAGWPFRVVAALITGRTSDFLAALDPFSGGLVPSLNGTNAVCILVPGFCSLRSDGKLALDLFGSRRRLGSESPVNVASVARALSKEVRDARDIFDSVERLGRGGQDGGFHYVRIWELATTIKVASNLEDREHLAQQVSELGDMSRDLSDEVSRLAALNINSFSWCSYEFDRLTKILANPGTPSDKLDILLHTLMVRLQSNLDKLLIATERAIPQADMASQLGRSIIEDMTKEAERLKISIGRAPGWRKLSEKAVAFAVGKPEPSKLDILDRDLKMSLSTVDNLKLVRDGLESTRTQLVVHRDQVGLFTGGLMGFHVGAEEGGLGAEDELMILASVVDDMKRAVKISKSGYDSGAQERIQVESKLLPGSS